VETYKQEALHCYQGYKAYQPMTTYWSEQDVVAHSEFRGGNVPANYQNLRALKETLDALPEGVVKIYFRGDTAANRKELLRYCAEGKSERFGVIEFAIGVDVTAEFKRAVAEVEEGEWQPLEREVDGQRIKTEQELGGGVLRTDLDGPAERRPCLSLFSHSRVAEASGDPGTASPASLPQHELWREAVQSVWYDDQPGYPRGQAHLVASSAVWQE